MLRNLIVGLLLSVLALASAPAASVAYITNSNGSTSGSNNSVLSVLSDVFGTYTTYSNFQSLSLSTLQAFDFVYVEGGLANGNTFSNYLNSNRNVLEQYVDQGGRLFLDGGRTGNGNSQNQNLNLGFGTTLQGGDGYLAFVDPVVSPDSGLTIGFPIGGDIVVGPGIPLISTLGGDTLLLERTYGSGMAWFGGLTTPDYGLGSSGSVLWRNMLDYMAHSGLPPGGVPEPSTLLLLSAGFMLVCGVRFIRKHSPLAHRL